MKVLDITGNPFSRHLNNGKTHESIFSSFDRSEICQLFIRPVTQDLIDLDYCNSFYCVSDFDVFKRVMLWSKKCGSEVMKKDFVNEGKEKVYKKINRGKIFSIKNNFRLLRDYMWSTSVWKTKELNDWLQKEKPDVIFIDGGGEAFMYNISLYIRKKLCIPIVYYVTDDFLMSNSRNSIVAKIRYRRLKKRLDEVVSRSSACYAIGEYMAKVYGEYFHKEFCYIMNSVKILQYNKPIKKKGTKLKVSYFGSMSLNRGEMIAKLASMTTDTLECNVYTFDLQNASSMYKILIKAGVVIHSAVKDEMLDLAMYESDILLHVESDDPEARAFTKFAVSTKIPEYLMHCRLVLGFGPTEVASMKLLANNGIGLVISSDISRKECHKIIEKLDSCDTRLQFIEAGYHYAVENFDKEKNSQKFKEHIKGIIGNDKKLI